MLVIEGSSDRRRSLVPRRARQRRRGAGRGEGSCRYDHDVDKVVFSTCYPSYVFRAANYACEAKEEHALKCMRLHMVLRVEQCGIMPESRQKRMNPGSRIHGFLTGFGVQATCRKRFLPWRLPYQLPSPLPALRRRWRARLGTSERLREEPSITSTAPPASVAPSTLRCQIGCW